MEEYPKEGRQSCFPWPSICSQLEDIPDQANDTAIDNQENYKCSITGKRCVGVSKHIMNGGNEFRFYDDEEARLCPTYNIDGYLAMEIRLSRRC
jgi:hypothetical protein